MLKFRKNNNILTLTGQRCFCDVCAMIEQMHVTIGSNDSKLIYAAVRCHPVMISPQSRVECSNFQNTNVNTPKMIQIFLPVTILSNFVVDQMTLPFTIALYIVFITNRICFKCDLLPPIALNHFA